MTWVIVCVMGTMAPRHTNCQNVSAWREGRVLVCENSDMKVIGFYPVNSCYAYMESKK